MPLPVHALDASAHYVVALTPGNILVFDAQTGARKFALETCIDSNAPTKPNTVCFPRLCTISPDESYVAIASDDKALRVWPLSDVEYGHEALIQPLAKRAGAMTWVGEKELVVADKFGDVWSFGVGDSQQVQSVADGDTEDAGSGSKPVLGHVSMVTCLAFLGQDTATPSSIVTCDRDEHIRISRWGKQRAAHIVQQYLLGSRSCVGAMVVIPAERAEKAGLPCASRPVLITSDGGASLHVWCSGDDGRYVMHATCHLVADQLLPHVTVDAAVERRREKAANNMAKGFFDPSVPERPEKRQKQDGEEMHSTSSLVVHKLLHFASGDDDILVIGVEGANSVFVTRLQALTPDTSVPLTTACTQKAPILDMALVVSEDVTLWTCCDDRPGMGVGPSISAFTWHGEWQRVQHTSDDAALLYAFMSPQSAGAARAHASEAAVSKLCLYSPIMTWPKPPQANADGTPGLFLGQESSDLARGMYDRFQSGKRAAGRAKNQASIQQQFGGTHASL